MLLEYQGSTRLSILSPIEGFYGTLTHTKKNVCDGGSVPVLWEGRLLIGYGDV